jgi:putative SOS response-associated peptidase YedK
MLRDLHNHMPVMLDAGAEESWLSGGDPEVGGDIIKVVPVSPKVNSPRYNEPDCIATLPRRVYRRRASLKPLLEERLI